MIELNLLEKKKPFRMPVVLGIDLNNISFFAIGFSLVLLYVPEIFVQEHFNKKLADTQADLDKLIREKDRVAKEVKKNTNVKLQMEAYYKQVDKLKERSAQVDEVLKIRTNPKKILEKIARSTPDDLWFDQIRINELNDIILTGGAYSARSIGEFITVVNDSPFFGNSITPLKQENKNEIFEGVPTTYEFFELKGKIKNFDTRSK